MNTHDRKSGSGEKGAPERRKTGHREHACYDSPKNTKKNQPSAWEYLSYNTPVIAPFASLSFSVSAAFSFPE